MLLKTFLLLAFVFISSMASAQNDTTVYYSPANRPVNSIDEAVYYQSFKKKSKNTYILNSYRASDHGWDKFSEEDIRRHSDTSFYIFSAVDNYIRIYKKDSSGFLIHDVLMTNHEGIYHTFYNWEGQSSTLFPLVKKGVWRGYSSFTGELQFEEVYDNNRLTESRFWISNSSYIKDVYRYISEPAKFKDGEEALRKLFYSNLNYPGGNRHGNVIISFIILSNGDITAVKCLNNIDKELTQEVIRLVNLTRTIWTPAKINDRNVNSVNFIPYSFRLK